MNHVAVTAFAVFVVLVVTVAVVCLRARGSADAEHAESVLRCEIEAGESRVEKSERL